MVGYGRVGELRLLSISVSLKALEKRGDDFRCGGEKEKGVGAPTTLQASLGERVL